MVKKNISRYCPFYQLFLSAFKVQFTAWDTAFLKYEVIQDAAKLFHVHRTGHLGAINFFYCYSISNNYLCGDNCKENFLGKEHFYQDNEIVTPQQNTISQDSSILFIFFYINSIIFSTETLPWNKGVFFWIFLGAVEGLYCKRPILCLASSEILTHHPLTARRVCTPLVREEDTLAWWRGGGGSIVRKTPDTALYSIYVSTLCLVLFTGRRLEGFP